MKKILALCFVLTTFLVTLTHAQSSTWTPIFDGKTLTGWHQLGGNARFDVQEGAIVGYTVPNTPNSFLVTDQEYGDFSLIMEVKIEDTTSNSGIQFRSHWDRSANGGKGKVFGYQYELDPSSRRWTGGIYDEGRRDWLYPLSLNPAAQGQFKLNQYNVIRIECVGDEIRTWINEVPAAYLVDMMDYQGFIALQVHAIQKQEQAGQKIYFRRINVKPISKFTSRYARGVYVMSTVPNFLTEYETHNGWKLLFNGENSKGWRGAYKDAFPATGWEINDGSLTVLSSQGKEGGVGGDIVTLEQFKAFDLSFEFKLTPGANSGVKYFVTLKEHNEGSAIGLEYQVLDDSLHPDAKLGREGDRTMASLYDLIKADKTPRFIHPIGQWNTGRIVVFPNNHVVHYLNGIKVLEYDRGSKAFRDLVAESKYKIWPNFGEAPEGHILLQDHGNEVSFRSIKLQELK